MTYVRKNNTVPTFLWFILSVLYFEVLFIGAIITFIFIVNMTKTGGQTPNIKTLLSFISAEYSYFLWIASPIFIGYSISLLKSAVTEITINNKTKEITLVYHSARFLFLKRKEETIKYDELDYYVDIVRNEIFNRVLLPLLPTRIIVFYRNGRYLLQFGCTMGWTTEQFQEIIKELKPIASPCTTPKSF